MNKISFPPIKSPLMLIFVSHSLVSLYALLYPGFARSFSTFLIIVLTCGSLDFLLNYIKQRKYLFPVSGIVSGYGLFFLFDTNYSYLYFLISVLTILAKHYITIDDRHIFNPTNFTLLIVAYGFSDIATFNSFRWGGHLGISIYFFTVGLILTYFANRLWMSLTFIVSFVGFAFIKSLIFGDKFLLLLLPILGPALHLYIFFMLPDPQTTPSKKHEQILFAFFVAFFDTIFRFQQNRFAHLLSLVIVTLVYALYARRESLIPIMQQKLTYDKH